MVFFCFESHLCVPCGWITYVALYKTILPIAPSLHNSSVTLNNKTLPRGPVPWGHGIANEQVSKVSGSRDALR